MEDDAARASRQWSKENVKLKHPLKYLKTATGMADEGHEIFGREKGDD